MDWYSAASVPPYRQRPSTRLGPTHPVAPPPWHPSQFIDVKILAPSETFAEMRLFATVLPAVRLGLAAVSPSRDAGVAVAAAAPRSARVLLVAFLASLALVLAFPRVAFPLAWMLLWFGFEAELARRRDDEPPRRRSTGG